MFIDEARIFVQAGRGGNGCVSLRREKHVPRGGPDGGDGGKGGSVIIEAEGGLKTLIDFYRKTHFKAERGKHGQGSNKHGKSGKDLILAVPLGTVIKNENQEVLGDLIFPGDQLLVAHGGKGGRGNARFATAQRRVPSFAEKGEKPEEGWLNLELRLLADVGIIGYPNVGKSTLISRISRAKPKIASYPFTTRVPNLGVVATGEKNFVVADIPGLIEGAHKGHGLGDLFLRHIRRTAILLHLLDLSAFEGRDPINDFKLVNKELELFDPDLVKRPQLVVGNKIDLPEAKKNLPRVSLFFKKEGYFFEAISALTGEGIDALLNQILIELEEASKEKKIALTKPPKHMIITLPEDDERSFSIVRQGPKFLVKGKGIERLIQMADLENDQALVYLQHKFKKIGLERRLQESGAQEGDTIMIGETTFEFRPT